MAVNKVIYDGETVIDLTGDTLTDAEQLLKGIIAHTKSGNVITGTLEGGGGIKLAMGVFTPASQTNNFEVTHNLGVIPNCAVFFTHSGYSPMAGQYLSGYAFNDGTNPDGDSNQGTRLTATNSSTGNFRASATSDLKTTTPTSTISTCYGIVAYNANTRTINFGNKNQSSFNFKSSSQIYWAVWRME